jgi:NAD(P)-dependent dehydrogenase (short-subunit alcohol dehydrogenase family)
MNENINKKQAAIVTGASSGIGLGITQALLEHGYLVVVNSSTITKSKYLNPSANPFLVDGDISKNDTAAQVAGAAIKHFGRIDLLDLQSASMVNGENIRINGGAHAGVKW